jgi:hypothetical protein
MQKRSPWQRYADGHAADFEAGSKTYVVIVTDGYVNARYGMTADRLVDRKGLIEDMEDEIAYLAGLKLSRGDVFQPLGKRPTQIALDSKDVQTS